MYIEIISFIVICFFVGGLCFSWGKNTAEKEIHEVEKQRKEEDQQKRVEENKLKQERKLLEEKEQKKELKLLSNCLKSFGLPCSKKYCIGLMAMLKDKYVFIPDNETVKKFIKVNFIDIKNKEEQN